MKIFRSIFLLLGCLHIAVGPLNCLQIVAWVNMIHDYSGDRSLEEAAKMTFSGEYPCEMCRAIAEAKFEEAKHQKENPAPFQEDRQTFRYEFQPLANTALPQVDHWHTTSASPQAGQFLLTVSRVEESVPTPPPRHLA